MAKCVVLSMHMSIPLSCVDVWFPESCLLIISVLAQLLDINALSNMHVLSDTHSSEQDS